MYYYKTINENGLINFGTCPTSIVSPSIEITEEEYNELLEAFNRKMDEEAEANKPNNEYGITDELYDSIIDDYTMMLIEEGVIA